MTNRAVLFACAAIALGASGCSNTVRYMTATHWLTPPGGGAAPTEAKESTPAQAPAAPATAGGESRVLYITYWEGSCSSGALGFGRGCSKGDSRVKRCEVKPDNGLACTDEKEIDKALSTSN
jgi:hypothetical protein